MHGYDGNDARKGVTTYYTGKVEEDDTLTGRLLRAGVAFQGEVPDNSGMILSFLLTYVVPILLMWVLLSFLFRRMSKSGGPFGMGRSTAKVYVQKDTGVTFADVAGEDEAKSAISSIDNVEGCTATEGDKIESAEKAVSFIVSAKDGKEIRPDLFRLCASKNWTIYELSVRKNSLEDIFHGLTIESEQ